MRLATSAAGLALVLAACADDTLQPPQPDLNPSYAAAEIPLVSRCKTRFQFTGPTSLEIASVCQIRGVGRVTGVSQQQLSFTETGMVITNTSIYTTPSGDQLFASFDGQGTLNGTSVVFTGTETFSGGTGRFVNASGAGTLNGSADLISQTGEFTTTGSLSW